MLYKLILGGSHLAPPELHLAHSSLLEEICRLTEKAYPVLIENLCSNFLMINRVLRFWKSYDGLMAFVVQLAKRQTNLGGNRVEGWFVLHADIRHQ